MKKFTQKAMISPLALNGGFSGGSAEEILTMAKAYCDSKGGYTETKKIFETEVTDGQYAASGRMINLVGGQSYAVTVGKTAYNVVCHKTSDSAYVGNAVLAGGEDTGEPFIITEMFDEGAWWTYVVVTNGETHISVTTETIHPIDKAYVPFWDIKMYETDGVISFSANGKLIDLDRAIQIAKSGIPSAITGQVAYGNTLNCYMPCSFYYYNDEVWMSFINPIAKGVKTYNFTIDDVTDVP